jgi:hypothetical protein
MKIAKPLLLVSTSIGVVIGLQEAWRLTGGLIVLMLVMMGGLAAAFAGVVVTIRREQRANGERP